MARLSRLFLLLVPVALGIISAALPGGAQEGGGSRYAFADTTLLRDTLNLSFTRLFPLADSLQLPPDTLRALSVRYQWSLERLVLLADSLGVPVDSVGPILMRERFNPLTAASARSTEFIYNSSYTVGQTNSAWRNTGDYTFRYGGMFLQNSTSIQMDEYRAGNATSLRQTRASATELGWRFSPDFSLGGRVNLERFDTREVSVISSIAETKNEYQISMRSRQRPLAGMASSLNFFAGLLDLENASLVKRGITGNLNTRIRYALGSWLVHELNGSVDGNLARSRDARDLAALNTQDFSGNVRGTISLFQSRWIGLKSDFTYRHIQVETPAESIGIRRVLTDQSGIDGTVRLRQDNERYIDLSQRMSTSKQATVVGTDSRNTRRDDAFNATGRYLLSGWALDARFNHGFGTSAFPTRSDDGGYEEFLHSRSLEGTLSRQLSPRITGQLSGSVGLTSYRYSTIGNYSSLPVSRDQYRQAWRVKASFASSTRFNTSLSLDVSRNQAINIPSASTGSNSATRSYRSEWNWSYRLLPGLTATQINGLTADYLEYPFFPDNNRLTLDYSALTTLNAVVTPHLNISVTHSTRETPAGNYALYPDFLYYFERADENRNSRLAANIAYSPSPAVAFTFRPTYYATERLGTVDGVELPQRKNATLDFSGGANVNLPVGRKGTLRGDVARTYRAERTLTYAAGVERSTPRSEIDYWNGSLQLSWRF